MTNQKESAEDAAHRFAKQLVSLEEKFEQLNQDHEFVIERENKVMVQNMRYRKALGDAEKLLEMYRNQQLEHAKTSSRMTSAIVELQREKGLLNRIVDKRDETITDLLEALEKVVSELEEHRASSLGMVMARDAIKDAT